MVYTFNDGLLLKKQLFQISHVYRFEYLVL